jgi:hypothetical protein
MPFAVRRAARRTAKDGPGAWCTSPIVVRLVAWRTASRLAHGKSPVAAAILGQFAVRLPHSARQIDLIFFIFFLFFTSKNSQKT